MLHVVDTETGKTCLFNNLADLLYTYGDMESKYESGGEDLDTLEGEYDGGKALRAIIEEVADHNFSSSCPDRFTVTQIGGDVDLNYTPELDESYLLLRLSEEDVTQVLYFYGLEDLEVSIKGDPTIKCVDGYEIMEMGGGCQVEIRGWLTHTQEWHIVHKTLIKGTIEETIQDIAHAKKGGVNHFAFL